MESDATSYNITRLNAIYRSAIVQGGGRKGKEAECCKRTQLMEGDRPLSQLFLDCKEFICKGSMICQVEQETIRRTIIGKHLKRRAQKCNPLESEAILRIV